ncbi:MAG: FAD-dependent oxidoreductase [Flavobacteriaceae bacterium]|nr:FAD-dependent oxidoreductase [Flavobacteriaceae bacterium]
MDRNKNIDFLNSSKLIWDVIVIGGGASGLGTALDSVNRGYKTLLIEKHDFSKGTSSRSTKLVHGGVRYLQNGDISLVIEALRERGVMRKNAPHLVKDLSFVIPSYDWWSSPFYGLGLKIYDMMAGSLGLGPSTILSKEETLELIPNVNKKDLRGGIIYHDGQFDDSRMAISLAQSIEDHSGKVINYMAVTNILKKNDIVEGIEVQDTLSGIKYLIRSKVVINATGIFSDEISKMDQPNSKNKIRPSQGVHIVLEKEFLKGEHAIMIPQTSDGRVLFAVPWNNYVILGTTDIPVNKALYEPIAKREEIDFIIKNASNYMSKKPGLKDIKSVFAGLRPLAADTNNSKETKEVSRHHKITVSTSGLISILGGKWTTYRKIGEDAINTAIHVGGLDEKKSNTQDLHIHGYDNNVDWNDDMHVYGSDIDKIIALDPKNAYKSLSEKFFVTKNQIIWAVKNEMAITLEDVLARRIRCLFLDAKETEKISLTVAEIMAENLKKDKEWIKLQISKFEKTLKNYKI